MNQSISAIITTYNRAEIVPDAITSVISQTYPVSELIVVDDGSNDNTIETVKRAFANTNIPTHYIFKENGGMATSLNRGIDEAQSEWIAFLDDDDLWAPDHLEKSMNILSQTPESQCVISLREEKGKTQAPPKKLLDPYQRHPNLEYVLVHKRNRLTDPFFTSTVGTCVINKELVKRLRFDPNVGARLDIHFFWRLSEHTDIALDMNTHGVGRQFRTSYLSTDDDAPKKIKDNITLRRNQDEIRMLTKIIEDRNPEEVKVFYEMFKKAIIGRVYLNRKAGNFKDAKHHLKDCCGLVPAKLIVKEFLLCTLRIS